MRKRRPLLLLPGKFLTSLSYAEQGRITHMVIMDRLSTLEGEWHELETKRERAKKRKRPEGTSQ